MVVRLKRKRCAGIFNRHSQWEIDTVCSGCGDEYGGSVGQIVFGSPGRTVRVLRFLRRPFSRIPFVNRLRRRRHAPEYSRADGSPDVVKLVATMPFKVYGMNGNPLGLRLVSFGHGATGGVIDHIDFGYMSGPLHLTGGAPREERLIGIWQGPVVSYRDIDVEALYAIRGIVDHGADFHRHWNLNEIERAPRREMNANIAGAHAVVELTSWQEPEQITLAHIQLHDHSIRATSLNLTDEELLRCLEKLVVLQENQGVLIQHQQDFDRASQELQRLWTHLEGWLLVERVVQLLRDRVLARPPASTTFLRPEVDRSGGAADL
ncbi:MAG: hypothetical protein OXL97_15645 [Chloroflexota bacterium]|nr:hypothetical protein [Chloroflexota bacterium]